MTNVDNLVKAFCFQIQVAAIVSVVAMVYMKIFLKESARQNDALLQPILKTAPDNSEGESSRRIQVFKKIPSPADLVFLLKSR